MIEFVPLVGDFVANGEPLFRLFGKGRTIDGRKLVGAVAFCLKAFDDGHSNPWCLLSPIGLCEVVDHSTLS